MRKILILTVIMSSLYAAAEVTCTGLDTATYVDAKVEVKSHKNNEEVIKLSSSLVDIDGPVFTALVSVNSDSGEALAIIGHKNSVKSHTEFYLLKGQKYMSSFMADSEAVPAVTFQINCENK